MASCRTCGLARNLLPRGCRRLVVSSRQGRESETARDVVESSFAVSLTLARGLSFLTRPADRDIDCLCRRATSLLFCHWSAHVLRCRPPTYCGIGLFARTPSNRSADHWQRRLKPRAIRAIAPPSRLARSRPPEGSGIGPPAEKSEAAGEFLALAQRWPYLENPTAVSLSQPRQRPSA